MKSLNLRYNGLWTEADLDADPAAWATETVTRRWVEEEHPLDPHLAELIAANMADLVRVVREQDPPPFMLFLLYPQANLPALAVVAVRTEPLNTAMTLDQVADDLRLPEQMLDRPAEQTVLDTPAGPALRMIQRYLAPLEPGIDEVQEAIAYAWTIDDGDGPHLVMLSTSFTDLVEAGRWRPCLDELAQTLDVLT